MCSFSFCECARTCVPGPTLPWAGSVPEEMQPRPSASGLRSLSGERRCPRSYRSVPLPEVPSVFPSPCRLRGFLAVVGCGVDLGLGRDLEASPVVLRGLGQVGGWPGALVPCPSRSVPGPCPLPEARSPGCPCRLGCAVRTCSAVVLRWSSRRCEDLVCPARDTEDPTNLFNFSFQTFDANDLYQGQNFNKVLSSLVTLNKVTADIGLGSDSVCARPSSHRIKSFDSLGAQPSHSRTSKLFQGQYRSLDMTDASSSQLVVRAKFNFQQTNEDELSFTKGDVIHVTRVEEGGWWEGTHNGRTGWFPSNYVREIKPSEKPVSPKSGTLKSPPKGFDTTAINKSYYNVVLQNILETENEYSKELQTVLSTYLRPLQTSEKLSSANISYLMGNLEEICSFQQMLVQSLEECTNEQLGEFMETRGASSPGILVLTTGLSRPFMRLDKYPTLLKELERHMEDYHPDRQDIQKSMTAFKNLSAQCQEVRKRKELELQILTEAIRSWEGDAITTLGSVLYMSQVMVQCAGSEEKNERYLLLFPNSLLMLSASPRMSGFIYQGKLPTTGMTITKLEDSENHRNAFEISGSMIERILVSCSSQQDLHEWVDHLQKQTKVASVGNPTIKPHSVPSHTLPSHSIAPSGKHADSKPVPLTPAYHTLPHPSHHGTPHTTINWGPLEPPKTPKPWSLSCLRPAPPLRPSAALCYKEDLSKSPKTMKKLLPKRKPERKPSDEEFALRKSTAALEEDAQILKVIEAYCTSAKTRQTLNSSSRKESAPQVLLPEEEKIIVEETKSNGQTVIEEKSLVDTVYALKDEVQELRQDNKKMKKSLEEEQRARKDLEKLVRKVLKNMNDPAWDETNL
uniref:Rho guanine nucleotide exchange factor 7 n=1 Tax=Suricata suricatta TaxID=37032 RepID=A0A673UH41_SURSU